MAGQTSITTQASSVFSSTGSDGRILITGLNNVVVNSVIGVDNPGLGLVEITSERGTLSLTPGASRIETAGQLNLSGENIVLGGVLKSTRATPSLQDYEIRISATHNLQVSGEMDLAGSLLLKSAGNIEIFNTGITTGAAQQRLTVEAVGNISLGTTNPVAGVLVPRAVVLEADRLLELRAGGTLNLGADAQLLSEADDSTIRLSAASMQLVGLMQAGGNYDFTDQSRNWTGRNATLDIRAERGIVIGGQKVDTSTLAVVDAGGALSATGMVLVQAGQETSGVGFSLTRSSSVTSNELFNASWAADPARDSSIRINTTGQMLVYGVIESIDDGSDVSLVSGSQMFIDNLVRAEDQLSVTGGTHSSKLGVVINTLAGSGSAQVGGKLDTGLGGTITLRANDNVLINGLVGEQVESSGANKVGSIHISSSGGNVTATGTIDALDEITVLGNQVNLLPGSHAFATGTASKVFLQARQSMVLSGELLPEQEAIVSADALAHLLAPVLTVNGFVQVTGDDGVILLNAGTQLVVGGTVKSAGDVRMNAGVNPLLGRVALEGHIAATSLIGGFVHIKGAGFVLADDDVSIQAGGEVLVLADATADGANKTVVKPVITTYTEIVNVVTGTREVVDSYITVPVITWVETTVVEQIGEAKVKVGESFMTLDATLSQAGYYNPNAKAGMQFREFFIEGIDYFNEDVIVNGQVVAKGVDWSKAGSEALPLQTAEAVTGNYKSANYKSFGQLSDAQRQAVLNHLGYMPLFQFSYSSGAASGISSVANKVLVHRTENNVTTITQEDAVWKNNTPTVYHVDVAGWKDKYIEMPMGAQADILRLVSQGEARYLVNDTNMAGTDTNTPTSGSWVTAGTAGVSYIKTFTQGVHYNNATLPWANYGVPAPATGTTFGQLGTAQKAAVGSFLGAPAKATFVQGTDYSNSTLPWASYGAEAPAAGATFAQLSAAQRTAVLAHLGYVAYFTPANGTVVGEFVGQYHDVGNVTYTQLGSRYTTNDKPAGTTLVNQYGDAVWGVTAQPRTGTRYFDLADKTTGNNLDYSRGYDPQWTWNAILPQKTDDPALDAAYTNNGYGYTRIIQADTQYFDELQFNTASLTQLSDTPRVQNGLTYKYWTGWTEVRFGNVGSYSYESWDWQYWANKIPYVSRTIPSQYAQVHDEVQTRSYTDPEPFFYRNRKIYDLRYRDEIYVTLAETFHDYSYLWTSQEHDVRDTRVQLGYQLVSQTTEKFEYRPVYGEITQRVMVPVFEQQTVWKTVEDTTPENRTTTVTSEQVISVRGAEFNGQSIKGGSISITSGGNTRLSGLVESASTLQVKATGNVQVSGVAAAGATEESRSRLVVGTDLVLEAGNTLSVTDSALLSALSITLEAGQDASLKGSIGVDGTTHTIDVSAGRNVQLAGSMVAGNSIWVAAGQGSSQDGGVTANVNAQLRVDGSTAAVGRDEIEIRSGNFGGHITLDDALLSATDTGAGITLNAAQGRIAQSLGGTDTTSGVLEAHTVTATADNAMGLNTQAAVLKLALTGSGDMAAVNIGAVTLQDVTLADGAFTFTNFGAVQAQSVRALGASDRNDISITTWGATAHVAVGLISSADRGDVRIQSQGNVRGVADATADIVADQLTIVTDAISPPPDIVLLDTNVNQLSVTTQRLGNVTIVQGARNLVVADTVVMNGSFTLTAGARVDLASVVLSTNQAGSQVSVTAAKDVVVRSVVAGVYLATADKTVEDTDGSDLDLTAVSSAGSISLTSLTGAIRETHDDPVVDLVANSLVMVAATGITGLEMAVNTLDAQTGAGDITLSDRDGAMESVRGLVVLRATTTTAGSTLVNIQSQNNLIVDSAATVSGATLRLGSTTGDLLVQTPTDYVAVPLSGDSLNYTRGVAFTAGGVVDLYRFFEAPELTEYRAGTKFLFGTGEGQIVNGVQSIAGPKTGLLPGNISSDTIIIESGEVLSLNGTLTAKDRLELISSQDLLVGGNILAKAGSSEIGKVVLVAKGLTNLVNGLDANNLSAQDSGSVTVNTVSLKAADFELRAKNDIFVTLTSSDTFALSGFVGGLQGFNSARNIVLDITGGLSVTGGIVAASGSIDIEAASIFADGASVFIADDLDIRASNAIVLNTLVNSLSAVSTGSGRIDISEADDLYVVSVVANNGSIDISAGGTLWARDVHTVRDGTGTTKALSNSIVLKASGNLYVDDVEAATVAGAQKAYGSVTLDSAGTIAELPALVLDSLGNPVESNWKNVIHSSGTPLVIAGVTAYDNDAADAWGYNVSLLGTTQATPTLLQSAQDVGTGAAIEVRTTSPFNASANTTLYGAKAQYGLLTGATTVSPSAFNAAGATSQATVVQTAPAGSNAAQVSEISFEGYTPVSSTRIDVTVGSDTVTVQVGDSVNGQTVAATWNSLLAGLAFRLQALPAIATAVVDGNAVLLTGLPHAPFTVGSVAVGQMSSSEPDGAVGLKGAVTVAAGNLAPQISTIGFTGASPSANTLYTAVVNGTAYQVDAGAAPTWNSVLGALRSAIVAGGVPVTGDIAGSVLTLTASADNTPFTVGLVAASAKNLVNDSAFGTPVQAAAAGRPQVSTIQYHGSFDTSAVYQLTLDGTSFAVYGSSLTDVTGAVTGNGYTTGTPAANGVKQVSTVTFNAVAPLAGYTYNVTVDGTPHSVTVGSGGVTADWPSVLSKLAQAIGTNSAIGASNVAFNATTRTVTITAAAPDDAFTVSAVSVKPATAGSFAALATVLEAQIEANSSGYTVTSSGGGTQITLSKGNNQDFTLSAVRVTSAADADKAGYLVNERDYRVPLVAAATGVAQVSEVQFFGALDKTATYNVVIDGQLFEVDATQAAITTWADVLQALEAQIESSLDANGVSNGFSVTVVQSNGQNALTISAATGHDFGVDFAGAGVASLGTTTTTQDAGVSRNEQRAISFNVANIPVAAGMVYSFTIEGEEFSTTASGIDTISTVLDRLRDDINTRSGLDVTALAEDSLLPAQLLLRHDDVNTAFTVTDVKATLNQFAQSPGVSATTLVEQAGSVGSQQDTVQFSGTPSNDLEYQITLSNGTVTETYRAQPGVTAGVTTVVSTILASLAAQISAGSFATATPTVGSSLANSLLTLDAQDANTSYTVSALAENKKVSSGQAAIPKTGDYVLILPVRTPGSFALTASGSLSVVALDTNPGETINLSAGNSATGGDLVVVQPLDVGNGTVVLSAAWGGIALGDKVTAGQLTVTSEENLSLTTQVASLTATMTGNGNLTVYQSGDLVQSHLHLARDSVAGGGNLTIVASGDVVITDLTGVVGDITIQAGGDVTFAAGVLASAGRVTVVAGGSVTGHLNATGIDIVAGGAVDLSNDGALQVFRLDSGGAAITLRAGGALTLDSSLVLSGTSDLSLSTSAGAILLNQSITSGTGNVTLDAAAGLEMGESGDITSAAGLVLLDGGSGILKMDTLTVVEAGNGRIEMHADGRITLGKLRSSGSSDILITSNGVVDAGEGATDIIATGATLVIVSSGGIGEAGNALETQVARLDLTNTGSGVIAIENLGSVTIGRIDQDASGNVSISTVGGAITVESGGGGIEATSGSVSLYAGGLGGAMYLGDDIRTTGGGVALTAEDGDIVLGAGIRVVGASGVTTGDITIKVPKGALLNDPAQVGWLSDGAGGFDAEIDWAMRLGKFTANPATGEVKTAGVSAFEALNHIGNNQVLRGAGGTYLQSTGGKMVIAVRDEIGLDYGDFLYSPLAIVVDVTALTVSSSERMNVSIISQRDIDVQTDAGNTGSKGGNTDVGTLSGKQTISAPVDAAGEDITILANQVSLEGAVRSAGATLNITPLDPTRAIVLGDTSNMDPGQMLQLDDAALGQLQDGFGQIVLGGDNSSSNIFIGEAGSTGTVTLNDTLVLRNPVAGGHVFINSNLVLGANSSLVVDGSGNTTTISATAAVADDVLIGDSVLINGANIILTAGTDGTGNITLGTSLLHNLNGNSVAPSDQLTLRAPGNVVIRGLVGNTDPLDKLTIEGVDVGGGTINTPDNVTFHSEVVLGGDLTITASGIVTFSDRVTLNNGGSLRIFGASQVIFAGGVTLNGGGNMLVEGNEITFNGGNESIVGTGTLTLRATDTNFGVEIGTPPSSVTANTLNIDNNEIQAFADGFSKIVIGHESGGHATGTGSVRLGAINVQDQPTLRDALEVYGGSITVEDYANPDFTFIIDGSIKLDAANNILVRNTMEARDITNATLRNIVLTSAAGSITQANVTSDGQSSEPIRAADLSASAATGISLLFTEVATVSAVNSGDSGNIAINETAAGGSVGVLSVRQTSAVGLGNITVATAAGTLTVATAGSGISTLGTGDISLTAGGAGSQLLVNEAIGSTSGNVALTANAAVTNTDDGSNDGTITTTGGAVTITSSTGQVGIAGDITAAGGLVNVTAATSIATTSGNTVSSISGTGDGSVTMTAGTSIALSAITADGTVTLTATAGAITDGLVGGGLNIDGDTAELRMVAATGIGTGAAALLTRVDRLQAINSTSGGVYITEATSLDLAVVGAGSYALDLGGAGASASIVTLDGGITVSDSVRSIGTTGTAGQIGNILLESRELAEGTLASITVRDDIVSTSGSISLVSADNIALDDGTLLENQPEVQTLAAGQTIDWLAGGSIAMVNDAAVLTNNGNVRFESMAGDTTVAVISVGTAQVSIQAGGAILDAQGADETTAVVNVTASALRLDAGTGVGTSGNRFDTAVATLAVNVTAGSAFVNEADALTIGTVAAVSVNRVSTTGSTTPTADTGPLSGFVVGATGGFTLSSGNLVLDLPISANGNVLVAVTGTLAINAALDAGSGNVTVTSTGVMTLGAAGDISTTAGTGSIDIESGSGALAMADGTTLQTNGGNIRIKAVGGVTVGTLDARLGGDRTGGTLTGQATWGSVSIVSGGSILDATEGTTAVDVYANQLRMESTSGASGFGSVADALELEVAVLSANAGTGGLFLAEATAVSVQQTTAITVNRVKIDGTVAGSTRTDAAQSNLGSASQLVLVTANGAISGQAVGGAISATGNLLLQAGGASGDIVIDSALVSATGHISLNAGRDILQSANVDTHTAARTIDMLAGRHITMAAGSSVATTSDTASHIQLLAGTGDIRIGVLNAGAGNIGITATLGSILDQDADGDTTVNISAAGLMLAAGVSVGTAANHLETTVATVSAAGGTGGIYLDETNAVVVDSVSVTVQRVDAATTVAAQTSSRSDLVTSGNGNIVLVTGNGGITLNDGAGTVGGVLSAGGSGSVLLDARGAGANVLINADVGSGSGLITVKAGAGIMLGAGVDFATSGVATSVSLLASSGTITMAGDSSITAAGGGIRLSATSDVVLGSLAAASVSLLSGGGITAATGSGLNVAATDLRLAAGQAIGSGARALQTSVARVSALASGAGQTGIFLAEADAIAVDSVTVTVGDYDGAGGITIVNDAAQADLVALGNGPVVLVTSNGGITLLDGDADGQVASATGNANILLRAGGAGSSISVGGDVLTGSGHVQVDAGNAVSFAAAADIRTSGAGHINVSATAGALAMDNNTLFTTGGGSVRLVAGLDITLGGIASSGGSVSITSTGGAILDAGDTYVNVVADAGGLRLSALNGIGALGGSANAIETTVQTLSARAGTGGINLSESSALQVGDVTVSVFTVGASGAVGAPTVDAAQSDLVTSAGNGGIVVVASGNLVLQEGAVVDGAVSAHGSGNIRLESLTGAVTVGGDILTGSGNVSVLAHSGSGTISFAAGVDVRTSVGGTIDIASDNAAVQQADDSLFLSGSGAVRVAAGTSITLGDISTTGNVSLLTTVGSINDADGLVAGLNDSAVNVAAAGLRLNAGNGVGQLVNQLETQVGTVSARAGGPGGIFLLESDGVTVGDVVVTVNRVKVDGDVAGSSVTDAVQSDLVTTGGTSGIELTSSMGDIVLGDGSAPAGGASISANGSGHVLVKTLAPDGDITGNADIVSGGGSITLNGGGTVVFETGFELVTTSTINISATDLVFNGGPDSLNGTGVLTLKAGTPGGPVVVGGSAPGALSLTQDAIEAIGTGFSKVVIGEAGLGAVTIIGGADLASIGLPVEILGDTITVAPGGPGVLFFGEVLLHADQNVTIGSALSTSVLANVTVRSDTGNVSMATGTSIQTLGGDIVVSTTSGSTVAVATLDTRTAGGLSAGVVTIGGGTTTTIKDANQDSAADIFAKAVTFNGFGPTTTGVQGAADVLEVMADLVYFNPPSGTVVRDSGTGGTNTFSLMNGANIYQQLVVLGPVTRVTTDPATLIAGGQTALEDAGVPTDVAQLMGGSLSWALNAGMNAFSLDAGDEEADNNGVLAYLSGAVSSGSGLDLAGLSLVSLQEQGSTETGLDELVNNGAYGVADRLQQAYVLGTPGQQPLVTGDGSFSQDTFEFWVDTLSL